MSYRDSCHKHNAIIFQNQCKYDPSNPHPNTKCQGNMLIICGRLTNYRRLSYTYSSYAICYTKKDKRKTKNIIVKAIKVFSVSKLVKVGALYSIDYV